MRRAFFLFVIFYGSLGASQRHIALLVDPEYTGEYSFAFRIQKACRNIGWDMDFIQIENHEKLESSAYDFVISIAKGAYRHPKCKNYLAIFAPSSKLKESELCFDGYLLTFPAEAQPLFRDKPCFEWYPTVYRREYLRVNPAYLFHTCARWGDRFKKEKFQKLIHLLDREPYVQFYGRPESAVLCPKNYRGEIPFDEESLYEKASQAGVSLLLHAEVHNQYGIPSGRIFEAAACSTVIISDKNPFVQKYFGDSVLYIDTTRDAASIFKEIQNHMQWIRNHTEVALEKARRAHDIFIEHFLLEDQLLRLGAFHDNLFESRRDL